jgi:hypothetical protein
MKAAISARARPAHGLRRRSAFFPARAVSGFSITLTEPSLSM